MVSTRSQIAALFAVVALVPQSALSVVIHSQCGGVGWTGSTACESDTKCTAINSYYSQCLSGNSDSASGTTITKRASGLDARMKAKGRKYFGNIADSGLLSNPQVVAALKSDFGAITPENSAKWDAIEPNQGQFNFGGFDAVVNFARSNGKLVRGHTFVWYRQVPNWVKGIRNPSTLTNVVNHHITTIGRRYAGKIYAWDVVNEIFNDNGSFRSSPFYDVLGPNFVSIAFKAARAADPGGAKLYINDYNLDNMGWAAPKVNAVANLVRTQRAAGVPIDGIGSQTHLEVGGAGGVAAALTTLANSGVPEIAITELDVGGASPNDYVTAIKACLGIRKCIGITVWGVSDKDSWRKGANALLYDASYRRKAAYNAVLSALA